MQFSAIWLKQREKEYQEMGIWTNEFLHDSIDFYAKRFPNKDAIVDKRRRITYRDFDLYTRRLAYFFLEAGIQRGDAVAIQGPGWAEYALVEFALDRINAIWLPLLHSFRESELRYLLSITEAKIAFIPNIYRKVNYLETYKEIWKDLPNLQQIIIMGEDIPLEMRGFDEIIATPYEEKYPPGYFEQFRSSGNAPRHIMTSSGTTGPPKSTMFSVANVIGDYFFITKAMELKEDETIAAFAPIGGAGGPYLFPVLNSLLRGSTAVILERWDPKEALELIEKEKINVAVAAPTQIIQMAQLPLEKYDLSHFTRFLYMGADLPANQQRECEKKFACKIITAYGAVEANATFASTLADPEEKRWYTVGRPPPTCELHVVDDEGNEVPAGKKGELLYRSAYKSYGYISSPELDAEAYTPDGFFKSGDIGFIDEEGYVHVTGRKKEMILRGGENIFPVQIENILSTHPKIEEVAVAAMPDPVYGEKACAFVVPKAGESLSFEEMISFMEARQIAKYLFPERLEIMAEIPKGEALSKVLRRKLTEYVTKKLKQEEEDSKKGGKIS